MSGHRKDNEETLRSTWSPHETMKKWFRICIMYFITTLDDKHVIIQPRFDNYNDYYDDYIDHDNDLSILISYWNKLSSMKTLVDENFSSVAPFMRPIFLPFPSTDVYWHDILLHTQFVVSLRLICYSQLSFPPLAHLMFPLASYLC